MSGRLCVNLFFFCRNSCMHLRHQDVESSSTMIAQGNWRQVWKLALDQGARLQGKREQNRTTARKRSSDETSKYALKCAIAGNLTKAWKIVCTEMTTACSDDTVHKLRNLHPERSLDLNLDNLSIRRRLGVTTRGS